MQVKRHNSAAFTLIEILIVTVIIMALATGAIVATTSWLNGNRDKGALSFASVLDIKKQQYLSEQGDAAQVAWAAAGDDESRYALLKPYLNSPPATLGDGTSAGTFAPKGYKLTLNSLTDSTAVVRINDNQQLSSNNGTSTNYVITVASSDVTMGSALGGATYVAGDTVTVNAVPFPGYAFVNWLDGGVVASTSASYTFAASTNRTLTAVFQASSSGTYSLTILRNNALAGTVSPTGGTYSSGAAVVLGATPNSNWLFDSWSGDIGSANASSASITLTMDRDRTIQANFVRASVNLAVSANNSAWGVPSGGGTMPAGTSATVTATSFPGYHFVNWMNGSTVVSSAQSYALTVNADTSLTAVFAQDAATGVTPGTYGDSTHVGQFSVDEQGRVLSALNVPITLADTAVTPGPYGAAASVPTFTVNSKGQLTAAANTPIQIAESGVTGLVGKYLPLVGGTMTGAIAFSGSQTYSIFQTTGASPIGAGYYVISNDSTGKYGIVIDSLGRVGIGGSYAPSGILTVRGDGVNPIVRILNSSGSRMITIDPAGGLVLNQIANATLLGTDAGGYIVNASATADGRYVLKAGDSMGDLTTTALTTTSVTSPGPLTLTAAVNGEIILVTSGSGGVRASGLAGTGSRLLYATATGTIWASSLDPANLLLSTGSYANPAWLTSLDAGKLTSGTLPGTATPAYTGDVTKPAGATVLTLSASGAAAGTYTKVTVDTKGRVTSGSNLASGDVTTALGYTPVNKAGDTMTGALTTTALTSPTLSSTSSLTLTAALNNDLVLATSGSGLVRATSLAGTGNRLTYANATGGLVSSALDPANLVLTTGSYSNPSWITALDAGKLTSGTLPGAATPAYTGDVTKPSGSTVLTLSASGAAAGTYTKVTVDTKGRVTSGTNLGSGDVTTALGYTPVNKAGDTMTGTLIGTRFQGPVFYNRSGQTATGTLWYSTGYNAWSEYMGPAATAGQGPLGNLTPPSGTYVTSWGLRSFIENIAGYGWTWESGASTSATPGLIAELSSVTGNFRTIGNFYSGANLVLHAGNYNSYAPTLTGGGASGTWGINITGNAATVTSITSGQVTTALGYTPVNRAGDTITGNIAMQGDAYTLYGPNSTWGASLRIGGNGNVTNHASVVTTNGNLHLDAASGAFATYLNYYHGTGGVNFGNGASGTVGSVSSAGNLSMNGTGFFGGVLTANANAIVNTTGTGVANRTFTVKDLTQGQVGFGAYPGTWTAALAIQSNDNSRFLWMSPLDTNSSSNAMLLAGGTGLSIYTGGSAASAGNLALSISSAGLVAVQNSSMTIGGNTALHAGNYNSYAPSLTGTGASGSWNITSANSTQLGGLTKSQLWNNSGNSHGTFTSFSGPSDFGEWFVHQDGGVTDGPGGPYQYYVSAYGLGNDYAYGSYAMQTAIPRTPVGGPAPYMYLRFRESGTWQGWQKIYAGYSDAAPWAGISGKPSTIAGYGITDGALTNGSNASGTWGISVTGNSGTTSQRTFSNVRTDGINRGSYGSISVAGSTNTYAGIDFTDASATLMVRTSDQYSGIYKNNNTWVWAFDGSGSLVAGSVPWGNVSGRPTISGTWTYSGQSGQPTWLWGTNDGSSMYVWNPANFVVAGAYSMPISDGTTMNPGVASTIGTSGNRSVSLAPNTYKHGIFAEFKDGSFASMGGNYGGLLTVAPYDGTSSSTGDPSYQMLFSPAGANSTSAPTLRVRAGIDATWGGWSTVLHSSNFNTYAPTLTGTGATGTWGISISGTASNVTNLNGTWDGISYFRSNKGAAATIGGTNTYSLEAYSSDAGPAGMSFHRGGYYAVNMGLDADNYLRIGGWSASANRWQLNLATGDEYVAGNYYANGNLVLNTANYNSYAPTLTGGNASGTWPIAITGASGNSYYLISQDTRNSNYLPSDRNAGLYADFKANATDGLSDGGTYHGVMTFRPYGSGTDFSGGQTTQLAVTDSGNLWMRTSSGSGTWGAWKQPGGAVTFAAPSALVGLTAIPGTASTVMRSDAAPALNPAIVPNWTGLHTFSPTNTASAASASNAALIIAATVNQTGSADFRDLLINRANTAVGSGSQYLIDAQVGGVSKFNVDVTGKVNATSLNTTSSIRFKENVQPLADTLDLVLRLRPVSYDWKKGFGKGGHDIGFIAEEVNQLAPSIVAKNAVGEIEGMDYSRVTPLLTGAIQQLKQSDDARYAALDARLRRQSFLMWVAVSLAGLISLIAGGYVVFGRRSAAGN